MFLDDPDPSSYAVKRTSTPALIKTEITEQVDIRVTNQTVKKVNKKYNLK